MIKVKICFGELKFTIATYSKKLSESRLECEWTAVADSLLVAQVIWEPIRGGGHLWPEFADDGLRKMGLMRVLLFNFWTFWVNGSYHNLTFVFATEYLKLVHPINAWEHSGVGFIKHGFLEDHQHHDKPVNVLPYQHWNSRWCWIGVVFLIKYCKFVLSFQHALFWRIGCYMLLLLSYYNVIRTNTIVTTVYMLLHRRQAK